MEHVLLCVLGQIIHVLLLVTTHFQLSWGCELQKCFLNLDPGLKMICTTKPDKHPNNALAKHYSLEHPSLSPLLNYKVLKSHLNSDIKHKISEVLFICQPKPELNAQDEMHYISRFLV